MAVGEKLVEDPKLGAGVLDTVVSVKQINGIHRVEVNNSQRFVWRMVKVYSPNFIERGKFIVRLSSPPKSGNYLWTDNLPEGTEEGDLLVVGS